MEESNARCCTMLLHCYYAQSRRVVLLLVVLLRRGRREPTSELSPSSRFKFGLLISTKCLIFGFLY